MKLLGGELDLLVVRHGDIWDHAPAVLLTLEAGGGFRDPEGGTRLDLRGGFYTNGVIDQELAKLPAW
jgi:fructose-1,6-bisphosphatase/inositol monophosphatase family enzyme